MDDLKLNGKLTLGENTADNGGARIALMALEQMIAADPASSAAQTIDGYTPQQRFFLGFGRAWCEKRRPEYSAHAGQRRSAFPGQVPHQRRGAEHAGIPEGIQLQSRAAHGAGERLPRVVEDCIDKPVAAGGTQKGRRLWR